VKQDNAALQSGEHMGGLESAGSALISRGAGRPSASESKSEKAARAAETRSLQRL